MANIFTRHPAEVGETYGGHLATAVSFGGTMVTGGLCVLIHAILPFLFARTGSETLRRLHRKMVGRADRVDWERHPII